MLLYCDQNVVIQQVTIVDNGIDILSSIEIVMIKFGIPMNTGEP